MEQLLVAVLLSFAIAAPSAYAAAAGSSTAPAVTAPAAPVRGAPVTPAPTAVSTTPARAASADATQWVYAGAQLGDSIVGALLGVQINKMYSLEVRYDYIDPVYQPNNTVNSSSASIAGVALFPLKLGNMEPFFILAKAGYERTTDKSTISDPGLPGISPPTTTVTTTITKRVVIGAGAQYDFSKNVSGRIGADALGNDHSVYLGAIYKF